ncbi:hypothetical protein K5Y32_06865 [Pantoea sp. DY-15]|uniref:hypothetical protein n=1 Tax=Pantoea sp. DY-15 TaxID=2871489 RepID=UPI001C951A80|nr:hypothetical protein [Pantoea sp. DY-15]MBY4887651.1 hypothetical protein [Pantoea sp. DY-15]
MDAKNFRLLCDEVSSQPVLEKLSTKDAYAEIQSLCNDYNWNIRRECFFLKKELIFDSICYDHEFRPHFAVASMIFDASNFTLSIQNAVNTGSKPWRRLLEICFSAKDDSHYFDSSYDHYSFYNKTVDFSRSAKELIALGINFKIVDNRYYIDENSHAKIDNIINDYVIRIGGINIINMTFQILSNIYTPDQQRFQIYRKTTQGIDKIEPEYPWGYIIALGAKHSNNIGDAGPSTLSSCFMDFVNFMRTLVSCFEIQPYSVWESIHVSPEDFIQFLQDNVQYDNLISFFQIKQSYALEIMEFISDKHDMSLTSYGLKLRTIFDVAKALMNLSDPLSIKVITTEDIRSISQSSKKNINIALEKIFQTSENQGLAFPPSSEDIEHVLKPVTNFKNSKVILPSGITCLAAINSAIVQISKPDGVFINTSDSKIGPYLEAFLSSRFKKSGIKVFSGDFRSADGKINGDCDLVISSPRFFYIFELKKKSLTRKAMAGHDYALIKDLGDSVIRSQAQCAKIEYVLTHDNQLTLKKNNIKEIITYSGKPIQKISVSLNDFGALQDKIVFSTILKLAVQTNFSSSDPSIDSNLIKWREHLKNFISYRELTAKIKDHDDNQFMDNTFMSLPQLMTILDDCTNIQDFDERFQTTRAMTYSTRDFYKEYMQISKLKKAV